MMCNHYNLQWKLVSYDYASFRRLIWYNLYGTDCHKGGLWMPRIIDLFAGLGGIRLGFQQAMEELGL